MEMRRYPTRTRLPPLRLLLEPENEDGSEREKYEESRTALADTTVTDVADNGLLAAWIQGDSDDEDSLNDTSEDDDYSASGDSGEDSDESTSDSSSDSDMEAELAALQDNDTDQEAEQAARRLDRHPQSRLAPSRDLSEEDDSSEEEEDADTDVEPCLEVEPCISL